MQLRIHPALHDAELRVFSLRARRTSSPFFLLFVIVTAALLAQCICCDRRRRGAWLFLSFPAACYLVSAASNSSGQPPTPSPASTCILPGLGAVGEAASIEIDVCISLKKSVAQYLENEIIPAVVQYLKDIMPKRHRIVTPLHFGLRIQ